MLIILAHLIQVFHILLVILVGYLSTRFGKKGSWIGPAWFVIVMISGSFNDGSCPVTALSNKFLKASDAKEFIHLADWLGNFTGTPVNHILMILCIIIPLLSGYIINKRINISKPSQIH